MRGLIVTTTLAATLLLPGCEKYALDRQMEELCAKDGGVRVYEKVVLPAEMFGENGDPFPGWQQRPESERLGNDYQLIHEITYLKKGEPLRGESQLDRDHWKVIRKVDGKVLGEGISYGRSGGDFIVIDHFTSASCPVRMGAPREIIRAVFTKGGN